MIPLRKIISKIYNISNGIRKVFINTLFWIVVFVIIYSIFSQGGEKVKSSTLYVRVGSYITDKKSDDLLDSFVSSMGVDDEVTPLWDILHTLDLAANDRSIKKVILDLDALYGTGFATAEEIGKAILSYKMSGKEIVTYSSFYNQSKYLIASYTDRIIMDPMGEVSFSGISISRNYWKEFLDRWKIDVDVFRAGEFKSYVEPYLENTMSEQVKEQNLSWMNMLWDFYNDELLSNREIFNSELDMFNSNRAELLSLYSGDSGLMATSINLVDDLLYRESFLNSEGTLYDYRDYLNRSINAPWKSRVAVITIEGVITYGDNSSGSVSALDVVRQLDESLLDDYDSVLIRINSGGGSAFASEVIRRKIVEVKKQKRVIISMGDTAASGGYWISSAGDRIFASQSTITGSIGVFGMMLSFDKALAEFGINSDGISTTPYFNPNPFNSSLSEESRKVLQIGVDTTYRQFLNLVSESRNITLSNLEPISGGRVWSGSQVLEYGLVDEIGGVVDALNYLEGVPVFLQGETTLIPSSISSFIGGLQLDDPKNIYALYY